MLGHHQIQTADDSRSAKESYFLPLRCFGVKKFDMVNQHIGGVVEERSFELAVIFDLQNLNVDAIIFPAHFFDAVDDRSSVIVAIGDSHSVHRHQTSLPLERNAYGDP